jgi:hypothetical protein
MARQSAMRQRNWQSHVLAERIQERGLTAGGYALFFLTGEGIFSPAGASADNGFEEMSGYVLDTRGRVFAFWLGWDAERGAPAFTEWEEISPEPTWNDESEYLDARREVGLPTS